jgi:AraC family transcriptional regulator
LRDVKPVTEDDYRARIERVVRALESDPALPRTLEELARLAHFSPFHFHRIYRSMIGESVIETARRFRLARAARLLATTNMPVTTIALETGYESVQTFSRAFSGHTRIAPREFRTRGMRLADLIDGPKPKLRKGGTMKVEIVEMAPLRAWAVRHRGPMTTVKNTYSRLWQWQIESGIAGRTKDAIGVCYGDEKSGDNNFRYYAGIIWNEPVKASGEVEALAIPGGKYCSYRLIGSHDGIPAAFERLYGEWLPKSGCVPDDRPALEIYRNNPFDTAANELITDLLIPIR